MSNVPSASTGDHRIPGAQQRAGRSAVALRFFAIATAVGVGAFAVAELLIHALGRPTGPGLVFPAPFVLSTQLLVVGSLAIQQALRAIRREQQALCRNRLNQSLVAAGLFMGVQSYALWTILPGSRSAAMATAGVVPFVVMLAALHGMHLLVATLFISYVAAQATYGRYDHEYHWGLTVCAWFWHALGIVWLGILSVYLIAFH